MANYYVRTASVKIGAKDASTNILYVAEKVVTPQGGDFLIPRTVENTSAPVGIVHLHKWWEITVGLDEDDEELLFDQAIIVPNNGGYPLGSSISTLGDGVIVPSTELIIVQVKHTANSRSITYSNVYVKNWSSKIVNDEDHQPTEVTFLAYGTRTTTAWSG